MKGLFLFFILICFSVSLSAQFTAKTTPDTKVSKLWSNEVESRVYKTIHEKQLEKSVASYRVNGKIYPVYTDRQTVYVVNEKGEFIEYNKFTEIYVQQ